MLLSMSMKEMTNCWRNSGLLFRERKRVVESRSKVKSLEKALISTTLPYLGRYGIHARASIS